MRHTEKHRVLRIGWLRAAVLGANDGIVSTASLVLGVAAAGAGSSTIMLTGVAGLVAGAMSMAAGEYVSVSSQADLENADQAEDEERDDNCKFDCSPARYRMSKSPKQIHISNSTLPVEILDRERTDNSSD